MKINRQVKIVELVNKNEIETQDELAELLNNEGYNVTQATISRDIRALKLTKVTTESGKQKYVVLQNKEIIFSDKFARVLREGFVSIDVGQNVIVIKTLSGMAMAVAAALDAMENNEILGCIAGDDTIMCVVKDASEAIFVMDKIRKLTIK